MTAVGPFAAILAADRIGYMREDETGTFSCVRPYRSAFR
jgi:hypothetical protein